jgi:hypothetical protein
MAGKFKKGDFVYHNAYPSGFGVVHWRRVRHYNGNPLYSVDLYDGIVRKRRCFRCYEQALERAAWTFTGPVRIDDMIAES